MRGSKRRIAVDIVEREGNRTGEGEGEREGEREGEGDLSIAPVERKREWERRTSEWRHEKGVYSGTQVPQLRQVL